MAAKTIPIPQVFVIPEYTSPAPMNADGMDFSKFGGRPDVDQFQV